MNDTNHRSLGMIPKMLIKGAKPSPKTQGMKSCPESDKKFKNELLVHRAWWVMEDRELGDRIMSSEHIDKDRV